MADVIGRCSTLPGASHAVPDDARCDEHENRPATHRVQGETDSFGAELIDMCDECYTAYRNRDRTAERAGPCDWCNKPATDLRPHRDWEEGSAGPVYQVCGTCVRRENERLQEELDASGDYLEGFL